MTSPEPQTYFGDKPPQSSFEPPSAKVISQIVRSLIPSVSGTIQSTLNC